MDGKTTADEPLRVSRVLRTVALTLAIILVVFFVDTVVQKAILTQVLPGRWIGSGEFEIRGDGTLSFLEDGVLLWEADWKLDFAGFSRLGHHPWLAFTVDGRDYSIRIGLEGLHVNRGERVSDIPWSFSLGMFGGDGAGGYVRASEQMAVEPGREGITDD